MLCPLHTLAQKQYTQNLALLVVHNKGNMKVNWIHTFHFASFSGISQGFKGFSLQLIASATTVRHGWGTGRGAGTVTATVTVTDEPQ